MISGIIGKKFSRGTTTNVVASSLAANGSSRASNWTFMAGSSQN